MANNPRNPGENSRGLNSIDNYIIDQFMTLQSPEELQQNLNQSRSIISNFFNNDLFAIRSQYTQKIEDLETKALINAENARYELELKNRKEINDLLSKSLADQAKGYEAIINDMRNRTRNMNYNTSSSSSSSTSSQVQDSAENMGRNIADAFGRGAQSQGEKTASIGMQLGSKLISSLTGAISKGLDSYLTAVGGKLDIMGSFASGNQMAANFRSEFGRYSYGNSLKEQANAIKDAYYEMRNDGVIVDPNILVNMYRELGNIVSLTGTSSARLTSLLNVTTKISESGGKLELDSASSEYLRQYLGEDSWLDINAISKYVQSKYEKINDALYEELINASSLNDRLTLQAERMRQSGASEEDIQDFVNKTIEDRFQVFGAFADRTNSNVASTMLDLMNTFTDPNQRIAENFRNNPALAALISELKVDITNLTSENWVNENPEEFIAAVTEIYNRADADTVTQMQQLFGEDVFTGSQIASLQSFSGMSKDEISALLREDKDIDYDVEAARNEVYQAQSSGYSIADTLNQQLEMAGFSAVSETYEDQTIGWLALIGNTLLDALGGIGGGLIGGLIQGTTSGIVSGLLTGAGGLGGATGGLSGLLAAGPWIAGAAAIFGTAYLIVDGLKQNAEAENKLYNDNFEQLKDVVGYTSHLDKIDENTGLILDNTKPEEEKEDTDKYKSAEIVPTYDEEGNLTGIEYQGSNTLEESQANLSQMDQTILGNAAKKAKNDTLTYKYQGDPSVYISYGTTESGETIRDEKGKPGLNVTFSKAITTEDLFDLNTLQSYIVDNPGNFTIEEIQRALLSDYVDDDMIKNIKFLLYQQLPQFNELFGTYYELGFLKSNPNSSILNWDDNTKTFVDWFWQRLEYFYSDDPRIWNGDEYKSLQQLAAESMGDQTKQNKYKGLIELSKNETERNKVEDTIKQYDRIKNTSSNDYYLLYNMLSEANKKKFEQEIASNAQGLDNIPYDGYLTMLHEGEMVIPAKRANTIRALLGQPTRNYSNVPANKLTGDNSFVQSIPEYASGTDYITGPKVATVFPVFAQRLSDAIKDLIGHPIEMVSGYRSTEYQKQLYENSDKSGTVAKPGNSIHETGWAADVGMGSSARQYDFETYPYNELTNEQLAPYNIWKPLWGTGSNTVEAWHTEGIETKILGNGLSMRGANLVSALIARYGLPTNPSNAVGDISGIEDHSGMQSPTTQELDTGGIPAEYQHLIKYAYIPRVAETLRRLGYNKSTTSGGYGGYSSGVSNQGSWGIPDGSAYTTNKWRTYIDKYAAQYAVPAILMYGLMMTESGGDPNALNKDSNASGLFQFLKKYWHSEDINVLGTDIFDPEGNTAAAAHMLRQGYEKANSWSIAIAGHNLGHYTERFKNSVEAMKATRDYYSSAVQTALGPLTSYVDKVYKFAGVQPVGAYLAEGGIVTSPTVAMIGEGKNDEAVIPLNEQQDYLGIQSMTINIIDALDIISDRICKRLDQIITLKKQSMNTSNNQRTMVAQRSARAEALRNFQLHY